MAEKETAFSVEISLSAVLNHKDGRQEEVEDITSVLEIFKDISLLKKHFQEEDFFHVKGVEQSEDEVLLKCFVFSLAELEKLETALSNNELGKKLTDYAVSSGLEASLGLPPSGSSMHVEILLEMKDKFIRKGKTFYKKRAEETQKKKDRKIQLNTSEGAVKRKSKKGKDSNHQPQKTGIKISKQSSSNQGYSQKDKLSVQTPASLGNNPDGVGGNVTGGSEDRSDKEPPPSLSDNASNKKNNGTQSSQADAQTEVVTRTDHETHSEETKMEMAHTKPLEERTISGTAEGTNIQKNVFVFISPKFIPSKNILNVTVDIKDHKTVLFQKDMSCLGNNIWTSGLMGISSEYEELFCRIRIEYVYVSWSVKFVSKWPSNWFPMQTSNIRLDVSELYRDESCCYHFIHILQNVKLYGLKDAIMQVDELFHLLIHRIDKLEDITRTVQTVIDAEGIWMPCEAFDLLGYFFGRLLPYKKHQQKLCLTQNTCEAVLKSLRSLTQNDVPSNTLSVFENIAELLCKVAFPKIPFHFFVLFEFCFPFLPLSFFFNVLDKHIEYISNVTDSDFENVQKFLIRCLSATNSSEQVRKLVLKLAQYVPLKAVIFAKDNLHKIVGDVEFEEMLQMKVKEECRSTEKKKEISRILELLEILSPLSDISEDIISSIEESTNAILRSVKPDHKFPQQTVAKVLTSKRLFQGISAQESVLKILAESQHKELHNHYIKLLQAEFLEGGRPDFITEWTLRWFEVAIKNHCGNRVYRKEIEDLPHVYNHLTYALSADIVSRNNELSNQLKERAFKFMSAVNVSNLLDKFFTSDYLKDSEEHQILIDHLQKCLFEGKEAGKIQTILARAGHSSRHHGRTGTCTRLFSNLLVRAIESTNFEDTPDIVFSFHKVAKNAEFWIFVLKYSQQHEFLLENKVLKKVIEVCRLLGESIVELSLSMSFAKEVATFSKENPDKVIDLILASGSTQTKADLKKSLLKIDTSFEISNNDGNFLTLILQRMKKICGTMVSDLEIAHEIIIHKKGQLKSGSKVKVSEVLDKSHWEPFCTVLTSCKPIASIAESESFWNLCEAKLEDWLLKDEEDTKISSSPEDDICLLFGEMKIKTDNPAVTLRVIKSICTEGLEEFENAWKPLLRGEDDTIGHIAPLINIEDMEKDISIAESHLKRDLPPWIRKAFSMYTDYFKYHKKLSTIRKVLKILHFETKDPQFDESVVAFTALSEKEDHSSLSLSDLHKSNEMMAMINKIVNEELENILEELSLSSNLVEFLRETALEDLRNLIDAVEEHSEQSVQESTVSALIDVKRFLSPVIRDHTKEKVEDVLRTLRKSLKDSQITKLDQKINECKVNFHGLKSLFNNVANRGEVTKEIVKKVVQSGSKFILEINQTKQCDINLTYKSQHKTRTHADSDIRDLRSRVLLLVNADAQDEAKLKKQKLKEDYKQFIQYIDDAMDIAHILTQLCTSGHPEFPINLKTTLLTRNLKQDYHQFQKKFEEWQTSLSDTRNEYYWLNFFYPEQLRELETFFKTSCTKGQEKICNLLSFTGNRISDLSKAKILYSEEAKVNEFDTFGLKTMGKTLDLLLEKESPIQTRFPEEKKNETRTSKFCDTVQPGQLMIAGLNENSDLVIPTLMSLYQNTTGYLPKPHQVLFCENDTQWEDIELLLRRCAGSYKLKQEPQLFSLVCIERLPSEIQFRVVDALKELSGKPVLFVALCRGGTHHPFLDHFGSMVVQVQHLSQQAMEFCLRTLWPDVVTVTSDVPGQGKSEFIHEKAWSKGLACSTLHLSGELDTAELVKKISDVKISPSHLLHIDIGTLTRPKDIDYLLFQLIVLEFVGHGSKMVKLTTDNICIEVANTISNSLRNSLITLTSFTRVFLKWEDYANFHPSQEICSPVQVVCLYLNANEQGTLDTSDLYFTGANACKPLPEERCRHLLQKHFAVASDLSFSIVNIFLNVLSDQLKKFSCSYFFRTTNIEGMLGGEANLKTVKSQLFRALLDVSREFAIRSINSCREEQSSSVKSMSSTSDLTESTENLAATSVSAQAMTKRIDGMIRWAESNHLILAFHNLDIQTLSALYRKKELVPPHIKKLFETQIKASLPNFSEMSQSELQEMLQRIARFKQGKTSTKELETIATSYALTPDNLLKMILIVLRTRSHVPVIIMGETGCGKTSLIRYLACVCGIHLQIQNIHAGIDEFQIIEYVKEVNDKALNILNDTVWLFLDEINTCSHLGLINTILCHHICEGVTLAPNLVIMAACNPYKIRSDKSIFTAGLETKVRVDEKSKLVYRVNPLPESMVDFVWDYGSLNADDEKSYIRRMVDKCVQDNLVHCVVDLLVMSQQFVREREESGSCVSLRDVNRCKKLIGWFKENLRTKYDMDRKCYLSNKVLEIRSVVLALAHSYHSRLPDNVSRKKYRFELSLIFRLHNQYETEDTIFKIIQEEQSDILNRMELPPGTACNTALKENVFVIMVCILNHIPVFVVGKPGCSKSLSLQLIKSNLRGKDSKDPYFKSLPQVFCVSYQGSESSTSDGIIKVFAKAQRYKDQDKDNSVLPVVVLDEIGLAETSRFNPLKVLHSLLEPDDSDLPKVAVVGISNWALDAAKMNRAIHLSRPDMDADELFHTGISISEASITDTKKSMRLSSLIPNKPKERKIDSDLMRAIADAYIDYTGKQKFKNFHGLRDFYSLVKYVSREFSCLSDEDATDHDIQLLVVVKGLLRNFGGLSFEIDSVLTVYKVHLEKTLSSVDPMFMPQEKTTVLQLVGDNIRDKTARHLLLATRGESALSVIEGLLTGMGRNYVSILGSHFEEDLTDDYNYRILSQIILCMEQGVVLVLKDLEGIYGSLYDMLNQNYTIVGSKKNCRVALGAYSNPLCHVHDDFRCIVLVEEDKLDLSDPPFLNRFEKQYIKLADMLSTEEKKAVSSLEDWIDRCTSIQGFHFKRADAIPIDSPDMVASAVRYVFSSQSEDLSFNSKVQTCKDVILRTFSPESVVRFEKTDLSADEVQKLQDDYFNLPIHSGLEYCLMKRQEETCSCLKEMIFTHSNLHTNVALCMKSDETECQVERLSSFKSEKQLSQRVNNFWINSTQKWLIIQCETSSDRENILLMKSVVDRCQTEYVKSEISHNDKHAVIIMHMDRNESENSLALVNFLSGWNISFVDTLEDRAVSVAQLLHRPKLQLIQERRPLTKFLEKHLFWAFTLLHYHDIPRDLTSLKKVIDSMAGDKDLMLFLEEMVTYNLKEKFDMQDSCNWQVDVACDRLKLYTHLSLHDALEHEIEICIKHPLAAIVYKLEEISAWDAVTFWCDPNDKVKKEVWMKFTLDKMLLDFECVLAPEGPECYDIVESVLSLHCPFSKLFIQRIETLREPFMDVLEAEYPDFDIDEITVEIKDTLTAKFQYSVNQAAADLFDNTYTDDPFPDYFQDVCNVLFSGIKVQMSEDDRSRVTQWSVSAKFSRQGKSFEEDVCRLHITIWLYGSVIESELKLISACKTLTGATLDDILLEQQSNLTQVVEKHDEVQQDATSSMQTSLESEPLDLGNDEEDQDDKLSNLNMTGDEEKRKELQDNYLESQNGEQGNCDEPVDLDDIVMMDKDGIIQDEGSNEVACEKPYVDMEGENHEGEYYDEKADSEVSPDYNTSTALVDFACLHLLPSEDLFTRLTESQWINGVGLILSLASEISFESKLCQSLRICSDFLYLVGTPCQLPQSYLNKIGEALAENTLESEQIFTIVSELINDLLKRNIPCGALQHFYSCYISSGLAANPESQLLTWTFQTLPSSELYKETYHFFGPTLYQTLLVELGTCDVLNEEIPVDNSEALSVMEVCMSEFMMKGEPDSKLACLILDVFQTHFCNMKFDLDSQTVENVLRFDKLLKSEGLSLKHLIALAYLKNFIVHFSEELCKKKLVDTHLVQKINGVFSLVDSDSDTDENIRIRALQMFFLKVTCQNAGLKRLEEVITDYSSNLPFLTLYEIPAENRLEVLELCPMEIKYNDIFKQSAGAYDALPKDDSQLKAVVQKSKTKPEFTYALLGIALQRIHTLQTVRQITDSERNEKMKVFYELVCSNLPQNQQVLFRNLCGFGDFSFRLLQASPNKTAEDHHMSLCVLHLLSAIISFNPNNSLVSQKSPVFMRCIQSPKDFKKYFIPGCGFKETALHQSSLLSFVGGTEYVKCSCLCSGRTVIDMKFYSAEASCEICKQPLQREENSFLISSNECDSEGLQGYYFIDIGCLKSEFTSVRRLSPAAFRILQFILHGCLAGSLALGFVNQKDLSNVLNLPESVDPVSFISNHLHVHWTALKCLTEMGDAQLGKLINFIIRDGISLFAQDSVQYQSVEQQNKFETDFTKKIDEVMKNRFKIVQEDVVKYNTLHESSEASKFETHLVEKLSSGNSLQEIPNLLREHVHPSVENMKREFFLQNYAKDYPIMALVFEKREELSLLQHLMPLLHWHKCVIRYGGHKLKRAECKMQSVQDFVHTSGKSHGDGPSELHKRFESFKISWNELKDKQDLLNSYNSQLPEMERIHKLTSLDKCLMMTKHSPLMQVLLALQAIQNRFLQDAAIISLSSNSLSVSFLKQTEGVAMIPEVNLEHIQRKQVISKPDLKDAVKFSQICTDLGHGRERHYDMYQIEAQVVDECLLGKPLVRISSSFPMIAFSGESLHKTDELFESMISIVGHEPIDKDLKSTIEQLKEKSPSNMQTLIDYLQMTFSLIKRAPVSGRDKNQYLGEFLLTWQSLFPNRVKEVDGLCQKIRLSQTLSLYEYVEDLVADVIFDGLEESFRVELPDYCLTHMNELVSKSHLRFLEALTSALKKIVLRYLQSGYASPEDKLSPLLMEKTLWPHGEGVYEDAVSKSSNPDAGLLHEMLFVEHIHGTIDFLTEAVEERKKRDEKKTKLFTQQTFKKTDTAQQRKKAAATFRKKRKEINK